ncbi:hypothetical protein SCAB_31891 [Streptomyces scabiei 87.22]|uniref:Uncharacterized protein n=1 Tax=Streptomyces scabiei (strain 87.22) TaxID=680198 RepID=C9ZDD2_STRSW|nr:hypothetical protein SCAB_31891 [Streptomyces scabiei 87.22]
MVYVSPGTVQKVSRYGQKPEGPAVCPEHRSASTACYRR